MSGYKLTILGKLTLALLVVILVMIAVLICSAVFSPGAGALLDNSGREQDQTALLFDKPADLPPNAAVADSTDTSDVNADGKQLSSQDEDGIETAESVRKDDTQPQMSDKTPVLVVYFGPDSDIMTKEAYDELVEFVAGAKLTDCTVVLEGNAYRSEMYLEDYTRDLSRSRAVHVADCLRGLGVPGNSITVVANGGDNPVPPDEKGSYWMTRRVEMYVKPVSAG